MQDKTNLIGHLRDDELINDQDLEEMVAMGLLEMKVDGGKSMYRITEEGRREALACMGLCPDCIDRVEVGEAEVVYGDDGEVNFEQPQHSKEAGGLNGKQPATEPPQGRFSGDIRSADRPIPFQIPSQTLTQEEEHENDETIRRNDRDHSSRYRQPNP